MKIKCEHCKSIINVDIEEKCNNCGAPYSDNKEYIEYINSKNEEDKKQRELKNIIIDNTMNSFKYSKVIVIISALVFLFIFGLIIYNTINFDKQTVPNVDKQKEDAGDDIINDFNVNLYNSSLEIYNGSQSGFFIENLLDTVIKNINKYKEHSLSVTYKEKTYNSANEILALKKQFSNNKNYNVLLNYSDSKYIDNVTILDK